MRAPTRLWNPRWLSGVALAFVGVLAVRAIAQSAPVAAPPSAPAPAPQPDPSAEYWMGTVQLPDAAVAEVTLVVVFVQDPGTGAWSGTLDIPPAPGVPGAFAVALKEVEHTDTAIRFLTPGPPADNLFEMRREPKADTGAGTVVLARVQPLPLRMWRITRDEALTAIPPRPQRPRAPLPYTQRDVTYTNADDGTSLAGTLAIPAGDGPHPAMILIADSGPRTRDQEEATHPWSLVLADLLVRQGVAVLRSDDRGVGASAGTFNESTIDAAAGDALGAFKMLAAQPGIDPKRIGIIGRGEGASAAAHAAARSQDVAALVLLAPPGLPGRQVLLTRERRQLEAMGEDPQFIQARVDLFGRVLELVAAGADEQPVRAAIEAEIRSFSQAKRGDGGQMTDDQVREIASERFGRFSNARLRSFLNDDPRRALAQVRCPVLALGGSMDLVVTTADNHPEVDTALHTSPSKDVTTRVVPGVNHLFQPCSGGFEDEYGRINCTIAPAVLDDIAGWLHARFGMAK